MLFVSFVKQIFLLMKLKNIMSFVDPALRNAQSVQNILCSNIKRSIWRYLFKILKIVLYIFSIFFVLYSNILSKIFLKIYLTSFSSWCCIIIIVLHCDLIFKLQSLISMYVLLTCIFLFLFFSFLKLMHLCLFPSNLS